VLCCMLLLLIYIESLKISLQFLNDSCGLSAAMAVPCLVQP
jgi:hypothetical protein